MASAEGAPQKELTPAQVHALFDILSHHETYAEIAGFKSADAVEKYGYPFSSVTKAPAQGSGSGALNTPTGTPRSRTPVPPSAGGDDAAVEDRARPSESPVLQTLLTRLVLPLPGMRNLANSFWSVQVQGILSRLGDADLSESYDKGAVGLRKTLATGAGSIIEMLGRGAFGGVPRKPYEKEAAEKAKDQNAKYDHSKAEELERAWDDLMQGWVYGDLVDQCCAFASKNEDLEKFSPAAAAAMEYAIIQYVPLILLVDTDQLTHLSASPLLPIMSSSSRLRASTFSS